MFTKLLQLNTLSLFMIIITLINLFLTKIQFKIYVDSLYTGEHGRFKSWDLRVLFFSFFNTKVRIYRGNNNRVLGVLAEPELTHNQG